MNLAKSLDETLSTRDGGFYTITGSSILRASDLVHVIDSLVHDDTPSYPSEINTLRSDMKGRSPQKVGTAAFGKSTEPLITTFLSNLSPTPASAVYEYAEEYMLAIKELKMKESHLTDIGATLLIAQSGMCRPSVSLADYFRDIHRVENEVKEAREKVQLLFEMRKDEMGQKMDKDLIAMEKANADFSGARGACSVLFLISQLVKPILLHSDKVQGDLAKAKTGFIPTIKSQADKFDEKYNECKGVLWDLLDNVRRLSKPDGDVDTLALIKNQYNADNVCRAIDRLLELYLWVSRLDLELRLIATGDGEINDLDFSQSSFFVPRQERLCFSILERLVLNWQASSRKSDKQSATEDE